MADRDIEPYVSIQSIDLNALGENVGLNDLQLYLGNRGIVAMWEDFGRQSVPQEAPPHWAYAWPGGRVLARYTLDNPDIVRGKRVLDFGAGSGINTIPAVLAGAAHVHAVDNNTSATELITMNCDLNVMPAFSFTISAEVDETLNYDVILMGDGFYDPEMTGDILPFFDEAIRRGIDVYVGDPKREYLPERRCKKLASYVVPDMMNLERRPALPAFVYQLMGNDYVPAER